jgi:hypothetical protein
MQAASKREPAFLKIVFVDLLMLLKYLTFNCNLMVVALVLLASPSRQQPGYVRDVLTELYNSTNGSQWIRNDGWLSNKPPCEWFGVYCSESLQVRFASDTAFFLFLD